MIPVLRAGAVLDKYFHNGQPLPDYYGPSVEEMAEAIEQAVLEEREACAKVADAQVQGWEFTGEGRAADASKIIAAAIRGRGR